MILQRRLSAAFLADGGAPIICMLGIKCDGRMIICPSESSLLTASKLVGSVLFLATSGKILWTAPNISSRKAGGRVKCLDSNSQLLLLELCVVRGISEADYYNEMSELGGYRRVIETYLEMREEGAVF